MLLEIVYTESSAEKLHSNEMKAVCEALRGLFTNLQSSESCTSLTGNLYLLGRDDRRHEASTLICDDLSMRHGITDLDQLFFVTLEKCDINISVDETCWLLQKLPAAAQPIGGAT